MQEKCKIIEINGLTARKGPRINRAPLLGPSRIREAPWRAILDFEYVKEGMRGRRSALFNNQTLSVHLCDVLRRYLTLVRYRIDTYFV